MAAATQPVPALLTLEEYMQTTYRPDCDFVDGHLEERNVGDPKHGLLQMQFGIWFHAHPEWNLRAISELRTRTDVSRIRIPDVAVVHDDELIMEYPRETAAFISIEILSPDDRVPRLIPRLEEFLTMGVPHVWLIDPIHRAAFTYTNNGLNPVEGPKIEIANSPVFLDLDELFSSITIRSSSFE